MELREGLPHQAIEQPHRMRPLFASVLISHHYNRGRHTITKSDLSKPVPCVRKNELHHHSCVKSAKPVWFFGVAWPFGAKSLETEAQTYIHTYIHTYIRTYLYIYIYICDRTSRGRKFQKKTLSQSKNLPIECAQGHRQARCPNNFFAVNEPSAVPWW